MYACTHVCCIYDKGHTQFLTKNSCLIRSSFSYSFLVPLFSLCFDASLLTIDKVNIILNPSIKSRLKLLVIIRSEGA